MLNDVSIPSNWKKIGVVGVDSGQIIVCDPCYLESEWKGNSLPKNHGARRYRDTISGKVFHYPRDFNRFDMNLDEYDSRTPNQLVEEGIWEFLLTEETDDEQGQFGYAGCCLATMTEEGAGQLHYKLGHPGAGVVASSGYGDGVYPVYVLYDEEGTVSKVLIDFLASASDEEEDY